MKTHCAVRPLKVFIVEDAILIRERLIELAGEIDGVVMVGCADAPADAVNGILDTQSNCVVLDYQLRGGTGVDVLRGVHSKAPDIVFVVLTNHATPQYRRLCMDAGASYFFDKSTEFKKIKDVIAGLVPVSG